MADNSHCNASLDLPGIIAQLRRFADARDWNQYHSPKNLAMAISVEASELLEIFQWLSEHQSRQLEAGQMEQVRHEIADVMLYLIRLSDVLQIDLPAALAAKMAINEARYPAERVKGSAQKYTAYE